MKTETSPSSARLGSLVIVGTGIKLGSHLSPISLSHLQKADVVFAAVTDEITEMWLRQLNGNVQSFAPLYADGKSRHQTYQEMIDLMLQEVRAGKQVVGAFMAILACLLTPHDKSIELARAEGYFALMEPGISAADCPACGFGNRSGQVWLSIL
ncbi:MAG: SAM-dependent methyltransferase [Rheinheimera sp.]|nr:SAM-dependent methyltransferase [Rheinheimera sp.]